MAYVAKITDTSGSSYDIKSKITSGIPYGAVDSTSTSTAFTATVDGITSLYDGVCVLLKNGVVTSISGFTININNLGAKPVYNNLATGNDIKPTNPTRDTTIFNMDYTMLFVYSEDIVDGGGWICYRGYDANTNTIGYQLRTNSGNLEAADTGYRYRLWFTSADGKKWVPANTSASTNATTARTMNTRPINPFAPIVYNSTNGTVNSGARPAVTTLWQQYALTVGYSYVLSMTAWDPVYCQCAPQTDGSAVMEKFTQTLPSTADGKIYIYLGVAYSATAMELRIEHPVFYHDGNGIKLWTGTEAVSYTAGTGLSISGSTINHSNSITAGTAGSSSATSGASLAVPYVTYDAQGHITAKGTHTHTVNSLPASAISSGTLASARIPTATTDAIGGVKVDGSTITIADGVISAASSGGGSSIATTSVTIAVADWSNNTCTKSVSGVTASNSVLVTYAPTSKTAYTAADVYCSAQGAGTLTFACTTTPTEAVTVNVMIIETIAVADSTEY